MSEIKLSFVVPVYNVENYLEECVNSIVCQIEEDVELILVDDGSTDRSGKICDDFSNRYSFISVIHKENGGLSSARNVGMNIAQGRYIAFVDSDDYIGKNSLHHITNWIEQNDADVCFLKGYSVFQNNKKAVIDVFPARSEIKDTTASKALHKISNCEKFPGSACTKIYKLSFLKANKLSFPEEIKHGEDLFFNIHCFSIAKDFDYLDIDYYYYRQGRQGSITNSKKTSYAFRDLSKFVIETIALAEKHLGRRDALYRFAAYEYAMLLNVYARMSKKEKNEKKAFFVDNIWLLKYGTSKRIKVIKYCITLFGINRTSFLIGVYMKIR